MALTDTPQLDFKPKRTYLLAYRYAEGFGRLFNYRVDETAPSAGNIEYFEQQLRAEGRDEAIIIGVYLLGADDD